MDIFGVMIGYGDAPGALLPETFDTYEDAQEAASSRANAPGRWATVVQIADKGVRYDFNA